MKEMLAILGRIDEAHVRPPLRRIPDVEKEKLRCVVTEAGLPLRAGNSLTPPLGDGPKRPWRRSNAA
jgi:hypothetical protein